MFHISDFLDYDDDWMDDKHPIQYDYAGIEIGESPVQKITSGRWKGPSFYEGDKIIFADNQACSDDTDQNNILLSLTYRYKDFPKFHIGWDRGIALKNHKLTK